MFRLTRAATIISILCVALALGTGSLPVTHTHAAPLPLTPVPTAERAEQVKVLEAKIAQLRKERALTAWVALKVRERKRALEQPTVCHVPAVAHDELRTQLNKFQSRVQDATNEIRAHQHRFAKLYGAPPVGSVELAVRDSGHEYQFVLTERDSAGTEIGIVTIRNVNGPMLSKVLTRMRADPTAPKRLDVVADPSTSFTCGPRKALEACAVAGYKTVTFTGYVTSAERTSDAQPDEQGSAPGFKWYEEAEKNPATLAKEIEDGRAHY